MSGQKKLGHIFAYETASPDSKKLKPNGLGEDASSDGRIAGPNLHGSPLKPFRRALEGLSQGFGRASERAWKAFAKGFVKGLKGLGKGFGKGF